MLTTDPVLDVRETEVIGTLKLRIEAPEGGVSVTVMEKPALPFVQDPVHVCGAPLQELSESAASKIKSAREFRFMTYPTQDVGSGEGAWTG